MRGSRSTVFDLGLAAGGCFLVLPAVRWLWPFDEADGWVGWPLVAAFAVSHSLVRIVDRLVSELEAEVARAFARVGDRRTRERGQP